MSSTFRGLRGTSGGEPRSAAYNEAEAAYTTRQPLLLPV
jgi:hypothetical protein